ncbi:MAG: hypothetical protein QOE90_1533 [Thermoplasmata archaeon]|jgi:hypothetical protein|nr:hypothetical protein [Thermoplasmata archaeon]
MTTSLRHALAKISLKQCWAAIALVLFAQPSSALTERELADQVGEPASTCATEWLVREAGVNAVVDLSGGHALWTLKVGVNATDAFTLGRWLGFGSTAQVADVHHDGTITQWDGTRPVNLVAIEDVNATAWFAILHLDLTHPSGSDGDYYVTDPGQDLCFLTDQNGVTNDNDITGFWGRAGTIGTHSGCVGTVLCWPTFLAFDTTAANGTSDALDAPANLRATGATTTTLSFAWDPVEGATSYTLTLDGSTIASTNATFVTLTDLGPGTTYTFGVRAHDSWRSSPERHTTGTTDAPAPPTSGDTIAPREIVIDNGDLGPGVKMLVIWAPIVFSLIFAGIILRKLME